MPFRLKAFGLQLALALRQNPSLGPHWYSLMRLEDMKYFSKPHRRCGLAWPSEACP
jgi:hypothetical protein